MYDIKYRSLIVPVDYLVRGDECRYGIQYAQEYMDRFEPDKLKWLRDQVPAWSWHVEHVCNVKDLSQIMVVPPNKPTIVDQLTMYIRLPTIRDAVFFKLTW